MHALIAVYGKEEPLHIMGNFHMVQNFTVFADSSAAMKIRITKNVLVCISYSTKSSTGTKFRTTKFSSEVMDAKSMKFCTRENFLLYGMHLIKNMHLWRVASPKNIWAHGRLRVRARTH